MNKDKGIASTALIAVLGVILTAILPKLTQPPNSIKERPKAIITGPTSAYPGTLVTLRGDASTGPGNLQYEWKISPAVEGYTQLVVLEGGKAVNVASLPGKYLVTLAVSNEAGPTTTFWEISFPGDPPPQPAPQPKPPGPPPTPPQPDPPPTPPQPDPPPGPQPPPTPPTPPKPEQPPVGTFGVSVPVWQVACNVKSATREADCAQLVESLEAVEAMIPAGVTNAQTILAALNDKLNALPAPWHDLAPQVQSLLLSTYNKHSGDASTNPEDDKLMCVKRIMKYPQNWKTLVTELKVGVQYAIPPKK